MMRICVVGDSHVAALKGAWDEIKANHPDVSINFFAARARMIANLAVVDGKLTPMDQELADQIKLTSEGHQDVDPDAFDVFLLYGMCALLNDYYGRYRLVSRAFLMDALKEHTQQSQLATHVKNMRAITEKPVFAALPPARISDADKPPKRMPRHSDLVTMLQENTFTSLGSKLIAQPSATLVDDRTTAAKYLTGSEKLQTNTHVEKELRPSTDRIHMNTTYGKIWLESFIRDMS